MVWRSVGIGNVVIVENVGMVVNCEVCFLDCEEDEGLSL